MQTRATVIKRKSKFHSKGPAASSVIQRDLDVIRYLVEKELKISVKSKRRSQRHVDAKRIFIALILYTYNRNLGKLKSPYVVTLSSLARYLGYKSHASISLHMVNSHKGNISLEDYLTRDVRLQNKYKKLKVEVQMESTFNFKKFLLAKKQELERELALINRYLKEKEDEEAEEEIKRITETAL